MNYERLESPPIRKIIEENSNRPRSGRELKKITITVGQKMIKRKYNHPRSGRELKKIAITRGQERS